MTTSQPVFQSRWGYHPCDYLTHRKLKFLNAVCLKAVRSAHAWLRWYRKDPHNRVSRRRIRNSKGQTIGYEQPEPILEPRLCPLFSQKVEETCYVDKKGNYHKEGFLIERVVTDCLGIPEQYSESRKPISSPEAVRPLRLSIAEIDDLCQKARSWLESQDVAK